MTVGSSSSQLFDLLISTLQMLSATGENMTDDNVADYLEELEGDHHTFLHIDNLSTFKNAGFIDDKMTSQISDLRKLIKLVDNRSSVLWNVKAFKEGIEWLTIHEQAEKILKGIKN